MEDINSRILSYLVEKGYLNKADYEKARAAFQKFLKLESNSPRAAKVKKDLEDLKKVKK